MDHSVLSYIPQLIAYFPVTLEYVVASLVFGSIFAAILAVMKLCGIAPLRWIADIITTIGRCCPTVIMLFLVFYGLPPLLYATTGIDIEGYAPIYFVIISFTFFLGGSLSEVARSAYQSIDKGQFEAAECVGLSSFATIRRIILPQLFYLMIPNLGNTVQFLMKEGALTYLIGCIDMTGEAYLINGRTMSAYVLQVYVALALIFWAISIVVDWGFAALERKFGVGYRPVTSSSDQRSGGIRGLLQRLGLLRTGTPPYKADVVPLRDLTTNAVASESADTSTASDVREPSENDTKEKEESSILQPVIPQSLPAVPLAVSSVTAAVATPATVTAITAMTTMPAISATATYATTGRE